MSEETDAIKSRNEHTRGDLMYIANDPDLTPEMDLLIARAGASLITLEQDIEQIEKAE
jgi:hypothetical protein